MPSPQRLIVLVAALVASLVLTAAPASAITEAGRYANQAHRATNGVRADHGLPALSKQDCLKRYAARQAKAMAAARQMSHQDLAPIMSECKLVAAGENVAYGYPNGKAVVRDGWMNSLGHRANILNPVYELMGVAARKGSDGNWYVAQVFGRPKGLLPLGPIGGR